MLTFCCNESISIFMCNIGVFNRAGSMTIVALFMNSMNCMYVGVSVNVCSVLFNL